MSEQQEIARVQTGADTVREVIDSSPVPETFPEPTATPSATEPVPQEAVSGNGEYRENRHVQAGRKGARRVHQLIQQGRLYEQEHGLKRGRQRLRQLIQLGKLYEQEHQLRPARPGARRERISRLGREELLGTLLRCLLRIARPSFRAELRRLVESLPSEGSDHAA